VDGLLGHQPQSSNVLCHCQQTGFSFGSRRLIPSASDSVCKHQDSGRTKHNAVVTLRPYQRILRRSKRQLWIIESHGVHVYFVLG
jgi:hypothetical protein